MSESSDEPRTRTVRLRADAPNDLAYVFDFPGDGLVTLSRAVPPGSRTVITREEFEARFCEPQP